MNENLLDMINIFSKVSIQKSVAFPQANDKCPDKEIPFTNASILFLTIQKYRQEKRQYSANSNGNLASNMYKYEGRFHKFLSLSTKLNFKWTEGIKIRSDALIPQGKCEVHASKEA